MTTYDDHRTTTLSETARVLVLSAAAGGALGLGDVWAMTNLPWTFATTANSATFWAAGPFVLAVVLRTDAVRAAVAGALMLVVAVAAYYSAATSVGLSSFGPWSGHSLNWMAIGVPTGAVLGAAGAALVGRKPRK